MKSTTMRDWIETIITGAWIGKATVKGLAEAMDDLNYTWGTEGIGPQVAHAYAATKEDKRFPVKLAA